MKTTKKTTRKGLIVQPDDLNVGEWYTVYGLKNDSEEPIQIAGMAFRIVAMNLPFIIGRLASDLVHPVTLDSRFLSFMRVSDDYVAAQRQGQETA
jgi:hypothetical protein